MATTPELHEPQIATARAAAWHQAGDALLTLEAARSWLEDYGLVLFAPPTAGLGAPAPSLVEATLGAAKSSATPAESGTARTLAARLVGEGSALPLNLLGGPGDLPDFLVSAQAFPFLFTLRGDKGWKRPPETTGAVRVTPLGLRVYEVLAEKGPLTVAEIVAEIGREVTDSAVARALSELWQMLRVLPVLQQGEGATVWELTTARFLKGVKAGANAGQPTALSALASLYLTQVFVATEEEIAGFLSPITARSRVRDVLHGLSAGRQLAEGVLNGKTVLYLPDTLPDFAPALPDEAATEAEGDEETGDASEPARGEAAGQDAATAGQDAAPVRIRRFGEAGGSAPERNLRGKPVRREGTAFNKDRPRREGSSGKPREARGGARPGADRGPSGPRADRPDRSDRPARPARREGGAAGYQSRPSGGERPSFRKPWDEERAARPPRSRDGEPASAGPARADRPARPSRPRDEGRPPRREGDRADRAPFRRGADGGGQGAAAPRPFAPGGDRPPRPFRDRPAGGDRPFRPRTEAGERPARKRTEGGERPFSPRSGEGDHPFRPREGGDRPFRPRPEGGDRPFRPRTASGDRPFRPRAAGSGRPSGDRPFRPREGGPPAGGSRERRGPGGPPAERTDRFRRSSAGESSGGTGTGGGRPPFRGPSGPSRGSRPPSGPGDRPSFRPGAGGGFRAGAKGLGAKGPGFKGPGFKGPGFKGSGFKGSGAKRAGAKFPDRPDRPSGAGRPARKPRPEDEA